MRNLLILLLHFNFVINVENTKCIFHIIKYIPNILAILLNTLKIRNFTLDINITIVNNTYKFGVIVL